MKKYMVIERFKPGCFDANYARFHEKGRMFPDGLHYLNSWVNKEMSICYQLMESNDAAIFHTWFEKWEDYVDFELVPLD